MRRFSQIKWLFAGIVFSSVLSYAQSSGSTPPPPPVCSASNAGALYTDTGTSPATVYTCSYFNLSYQWVVNPSYGGIVYYPTLPSTCSAALPVFLSGFPTANTLYVCQNGVPVKAGASYLPLAGGTMDTGAGITAGSSPSSAYCWNTNGGVTGCSGTGSYVVLSTPSPQTMAGPLITPSITASVNTIINPQAPPYNAKCDGVTDDTAAFTAALKAGLTVQVPIGTCAVSGALYFSGERIIGTSMTQSVLKWIGSSPSMPTSISAASVTSNVATITTTTAHGLQPNETVVVEGVTNTVFNGTFIVTSIPTTTTFTYALVTANTSSSGGTAGMYYLLDSSKTPAGGTPSTFNFVEGWLSNLTVNCNSVAGVSGIFQQGDNGGANNILVENCVDGYTSYQGYMGPATHVVAKNSSSQGIFIKNLPGQLNGSTQGGSLWANGFGTYGIHIRATPGKFDLLYAQDGGANATYPMFFEGDSPGVTRTPGLECANCVVDGGGGVDSFRIRRYYLTMDSMNVYTSTPSGDVVVFDDAWGTVTNPNIYTAPAVGHYDFASLGTPSGLSGEILLIGGGGTINPTNSTDFSGMGFLNGTATTAAILASDGVATAPSYAFLSEPGLGMYRTGSGTIGFGASGAEMAQISAGGIATLGLVSFCSSIPFTCYGGLNQHGTDEIVTLDHNGTVSGGNFSANILRVGINSTDTGISRAAAGSFAFGNGTQGSVSGFLTGAHFKASGTPTIACGTGAGTSPTVCTITGNDEDGVINITTGSAPANAATIATITIANACPVGIAPILRSANANASSLTGNTHDYPSGVSTTQWTMTSNATGLAATTAYKWDYHAGCY